MKLLLRSILLLSLSIVQVNASELSTSNDALKKLAQCISKSFENEEDKELLLIWLITKTMQSDSQKDEKTSQFYSSEPSLSAVSEKKLKTRLSNLISSQCVKEYNELKDTKDGQ